MKFECSLSAVWRSVAIALARGLASQESRSIRCRIRPDARALRATSNPPDRCSSSPGQRAAPCPRSRDLVRFVSRVVVAQAAPRLRKAAIGAVSVPRDEPWPPVSGAPPVQFRSPSASASARLVHAGAPSVQFQARGPGRHMMSEVSDVATQLCALPTFDDSVCGHSKRRTAMSSKLWVMEDSTGRIC